MLFNKNLKHLRHRFQYDLSKLRFAAWNNILLPGGCGWATEIEESIASFLERNESPSVTILLPYIRRKRVGYNAIVYDSKQRIAKWIRNDDSCNYLIIKEVVGVAALNLSPNCENNYTNSFKKVYMCNFHGCPTCGNYRSDYSWEDADSKSIKSILDDYIKGDYYDFKLGRCNPCKRSTMGFKEARRRYSNHKEFELIYGANPKIKQKTILKAARRKWNRISNGVNRVTQRERNFFGMLLGMSKLTNKGIS